MADPVSRLLPEVGTDCGAVLDNVTSAASEGGTAGNIGVVRRYIERCWNGHDASVVDELVASDFLGHSGPLLRHGRASVAREIAAMAATVAAIGRAPPYVIEHMLATGDWVVTRVSREDLSSYTRARLREAYQGSPHVSVIPDERLSGLVMHRLQAGLIVEEWRWLETAPLAEEELLRRMERDRADRASAPPGHPPT